jgi:hypothetical protein
VATAELHLPSTSHHLATSTERTRHKAKAVTSVDANPINKNGKFSSNMHFILS